MRTATLKEVQTYFGMSASECAKEWRELDPSDKEEFKRLLGELLEKTTAAQFGYATPKGGETNA